MANLATIADRRRMRAERRARALLRREFGRFAVEASESPRRLGPIVDKHRERIASILARAYGVVIPIGIELAEEQMNKSTPSQIAFLARTLIGRMSTSFKQDESTEVVLDRILDEWVGTRSFTQASSISASSRQIAQRVLRESIAVGRSERETAQAIRDAVGGLSRSRALTIARTETHGAMMNAGAQSASEFGATRKQWVAIEDSRTRDTHRSADGQIVDLKGRFNVGGAALRFPGDPSAGAPGETINCRCALAYL